MSDQIRITTAAAIRNGVAISEVDAPIAEGEYEAATPDGGALRAQVTPLADGRSLIGVLVPELAAGTSLELTLTPVAEPKSGMGIDLLDQPENGRVVVKYSGIMQTIYHYGSQNFKPRFYPITVPCAKLGDMEDFNTQYPKGITDDSPPDHIWHRSLWYACGDVNGVDFYLENGGEGRTVHERFTDVFSGPVFGGFREHLNWVTPDAETLVRDERRFLMYRRKGTERVFDIEAAFTAANKPVTFGQTNENALPLIRVNDLIDEWDGGRITLESGIVGGTDGVGKRARWGDYSGPLIRKPGKEPEWWGIAMLDHPGNCNHPNAWFARSYGPLGTNLPFFDGALTLQPGKTWTLRHRIVVHEGAADIDALDAHWRAFATPPSIEIA
jgi:hypothetical protein